MKTKNIKGIVIREVPLKESDKLLTILTREEGLIKAYAKYARKPGKNMLISTSIVSFSEFTLAGTESGGFFVNSAHVIEGFPAIKDDVIRLTYCSHMMELILDSLVDASSGSDIYTLLLYTLQNISNPEKDHKMIVHAFELKLLNILGLMPLLDSCVVCGKLVSQMSGNRYCFSYHHCGICCDNASCRSGADSCTLISHSTYECLKFIATSDIPNLYRFTLRSEYVKELAMISTRFLCERLEKCYTKLDMLEEFSL